MRLGILLANQYINLRDCGNLFLCVGGNSGDVTLGEIWFDYEVEFMTPQIDSTHGASRSSKVTSTGSQTAALPLGQSPIIEFSRDEIFDYTNGSGALTFKSDYQGMFVVEVVGTGLSGFSTAASNVDSSVGAGALFNTGATTGIGIWIVRAQRGQVWDVSMSATTITASELRVGGYLGSLG